MFCLYLPRIHPILPSSCKLFLKTSVFVAPDLVLLFPAIQLTSLGRPEALACLLTYPGLILIDHGHFQYNSARYQLPPTLYWASHSCWGSRN